MLCNFLFSFFFYKYFYDILILNYLYYIYFFFGSYSLNLSVFKILNVLVNILVMLKWKMMERDDCVYWKMMNEFF